MKKWKWVAFESARDKKTGQSNRYQIFADGHEEIFDVQIVHETPAGVVADECSDHATNSTQKCSKEQ